MRLDKLTIKAQEAVSDALDVASQHGNPEIAPIHLLHALIGQKQGAVASILQRVGIAPEQVAAQAQKKIESLPHTSGAGAQPGIGTAGQRAFDEGWKVARELKDEYLSTEHIFLGILALGSDPAAQILSQAGVSKHAVLSALREVRGSQRVTDPNAEDQYDAL